MSGLLQGSFVRRSPLLMFDDLFGVNDRLDSASELSFNMDARDDDDGNIVIRVDCPGVYKDDVNVTLEDGILTISAKRTSQCKEASDNNVYLQECTFGSFSRSLRMPSDISDDVHATLKDGVLQLILKRKEDAPSRKIKIS